MTLYQWKNNDIILGENDYIIIWGNNDNILVENNDTIVVENNGTIPVENNDIMIGERNSYGGRGPANFYKWWIIFSLDIYCFGQGEGRGGVGSIAHFSYLHVIEKCKSLN